MGPFNVRKIVPGSIYISYEVRCIYQVPGTVRYEVLLLGVRSTLYYTTVGTVYSEYNVYWQDGCRLQVMVTVAGRAMYSYSIQYQSLEWLEEA